MNSVYYHSLMTQAETVLAEKWGQPDRKASFGKAGETFGLFRWSVEANTSTSATIYAAFNRDERQKPLVTIALFDHPYDDIAKEMTWTHREIEAMTSINPGDTLDLENPLWPGSNFHVVFLANILPTTKQLLFDAGLVYELETIELVQIVPIFDSEIELKNLIGVEQFISRLDACAYLNPIRGPLSPGS